MQGEFLDTSSLKDAISIIDTHVRHGLSKEAIPLIDTLGRVTAADLVSPEDLPEFPRSTVDGYAVKAEDTFGASEGTPIYLEVLGEVMMGKAEVFDTEGLSASGLSSRIRITDYSAIRIPTGGMLPEGADAVVMVEYTQQVEKDRWQHKGKPDADTGNDAEKDNPDLRMKHTSRMIEISRAVSPGEHVIQAGEDIRSGDLLFRRGHLIRPQDIGVLAGIGITEVGVYRRPRISIISTGPEICPIDQRPKEAQVRDINAYTMSALVEESGGDAVMMGICPDDLDRLKALVREALNRSDCVLISGGSSVGTRDFTYQAISDLGPPGVLIHGLSIRPGKPTIIGLSGEKPIIGLPGHPASAMVVARAIVCPLIWRLAGLSSSVLEMRIRSSAKTVLARLARNVPSQAGKEDFVRIALALEEDDKNGDSALMAYPIFGKSGLISTLIKAHGILRIPTDSEGAYKDDMVHIELF